jgi:exopolyphosphatase/guanosine-5'-triphosphate,3'-diphosphate pyrophosphatase
VILVTLSPVKGVKVTVPKKKTAIKLELPVRFAAIDLGSNSLKLRISEITEPGKHNTLFEEKYPVRLGHETFLTGKLSRENIKETVKVMREISKECRKYAVDVFSAVATSAVREASNRQLLVSEIARATGIEVQIIPGSEESRLIALGNLGDMAPTRQDYLIIDIGGGSAEVILTNDFNIMQEHSLPLGAVRLKEQYAPTDILHQREFDILHDQIVATLKNYLKIITIPQDTLCYGCAGTIRALIEINTEENWREAENKTISLARINGLIEQMRRMTLPQKVKKFGLEKRRAEITLPGAMVLAEIMRFLALPEVQLSPYGVRDGLLQDFMETSGFKHEIPFERERAFVKGLFAMVDRFHSSREHQVHVCNLALSLFDILKPLHHYGVYEKNVLKGAALLHDIGQYISYSKHHKHSYYIIIHSDMPGMTEKEKLLIATISRYHRRALPNLKQPEFQGMDAKERMMVRKLAGILRIADALDKEHQSFVTAVDCKIRKDKVEFLIKTSRHVPVELWAAAHKATLFEQVFHKKAVFKEITE